MAGTTVTLSIPGASKFDGQRIAVVGIGVSGRASIQALHQHTDALLGAWDARAQALEALDPSALDVCESCADPERLIEAVLQWNPDIVIISPGFRQTGVEWRRLRQAGIPVWSEIELAWHLRACDENGQYAPWLCITGTNGKTTTVTMLETILNSAGLRALAVGNVGTPAVTAVSDTSSEAPNAFAFELSSFQLAATYSMEPTASVVLNVADDHLEWHENRDEYVAAKASIYERTHQACVFPLHDADVRIMVDNADVIEGARAIGVSLGVPNIGEIGIVDDIIVDRAFGNRRQVQAIELFTIADVTHLAPQGYDLPVHIVKDAMMAATLARSVGTSPSAIREGLRRFHPDAHRIELVTQHAKVAYIDDSKATNTHSAQASLLVQKPASTIWIAGGLAKGARFEELVERVSDRLAGVIVIGTDQEPWRAALDNLSIPVIFIDTTSNEPMHEAVAHAHSLARPGQTVLLAPACASQDQFTSYADRGNRFAQEVRELVVAGEEE
ncbi:UDP-N-acetylmuramoyl-L-alanine--D-glutamate ligase [Arcanobacterium phocae]|uniref:UDP-N-acetylmuramoyl-L-alanine--D-glutamate ligase n=1 Tax=Arcanobacterium phocae TaxID=131112 RepID=UPI001C0F25F0|nr:UDP-N-acetylmuramoyl-L-alanine--D-glutamate ligase [Arcanobacterium phocae]